MQGLPFEVRKDLPGWRLFWAELELAPGESDRLSSVLKEVASSARARLARRYRAASPRSPSFSGPGLPSARARKTFAGLMSLWIRPWA